jgi:predicted nucleotidyltransferase
MKPLEHYKQVLSLLKPELQHRFHVQNIGFFGSVVREDFSPEKSDLDLIVDFQQPVGIEFIELAEFLENKLNRKVDLVSRNCIKLPYLKIIEPEVIYV